MQKTNFGNLSRGIILSYASMAISILVSLLYTPLVIRYLGQQQYGLYSTASSVIGYLSLFNFGLGSTVIMYTTKLRAQNRQKEVESIYGLFLTIYSFLAILVLISGAAIVCFSDKIFSVSTGAEGHQQLKIIIALMVINLVVSFPASVYQSIITSYEKFAFLKGISIAITLLTPAIMIPLLLCGHKAITLTIVVQAVHICASIVYSLYVHLKLKVKVSFNFKILDKSIYKSIFSYSGYIFLGLIVDQLYWNTDKIILSVMIGEIPVAIYAVASQIHSYYQQFSGSISEVFFPKVTRLVAEDTSIEKLSSLFIKIGRMQALVMFMILFGFIAFGQEFIMFWAGPGYEQAYVISLLVVAPATIPLIESTGFLIIKAMNRHKFRSILYLVIAIANVVLSIPACIYWGPIGCALCTCICVIIGHGFIMNWFYWRRIKLNIPRFWKQITVMIIPGALLGAIALIVNRLLPSGNIFVFAAKIVVFVIIYAAIQFALILNQDEKNIILGIINRIFKKSVKDEE